MAPIESWGLAQRHARSVVASMRWETALKPILERADALRENGRSQAAFELYDSPELSGHARAQYWAGTMLSGAAHGSNTAAERLTRAMFLGHLAAGNMLGVLFLQAAERAKDEPPAEVCEAATFALAMASRSAQAATALLYRARLYRTGLCEVKNIKWAVDSYEDSARAGIAEAAAELAAMYTRGTEVPMDAERAAYWEQRASVASGKVGNREATK